MPEWFDQLQQKNEPPAAVLTEGREETRVTPILASHSAGVKAGDYVRAGWVLVPIPAGTKGPRTKGWNTREQCITTVGQCDRLRGNVGLAHAFSKTCCLDVDDVEKARDWLAGHGIDLDGLLRAPDAVRISSGRPGRAKLLYRLPNGVPPLPTKSPVAEAGLELRCATADGRTVQDVLPPSIHPDTGEAYIWELGDPLVASWSDPPVLPPELLALWQSLLKPAALEAPPRAPLGLSDQQLKHVLNRSLKHVLEQTDPHQIYPDWLAVGMALHHETEGQSRGLHLWDEWSQQVPKYAGLDDLATKWESFGRTSGPMRTMSGLMAVLPPDASEFEDLTQLDAGKPPRFVFQSADEFMVSSPARWLIKGVLPQAGLAVVFGESGSGKSFLVLDLVLALTRGVSWRGLRTRQVRAAYIVAEGVGGFRGRLQAYRQHVAADLGEIFVLGDSPSLLATADVGELIRGLQTLGELGVIVIDTLAQTTPGANENSGEDMGKALAHCKRIHQATGALVLLVHHSGKDAARGARGWSGLKAAADAEIEVLRDGDHRTLRVSKLKDGEDGGELGFRLQPVVLGLDEDGDEVTSCVVDHLDDGVKLQRRRAAPRGRVQRGRVQRVVMRVLHELAGLGLGAVLVTDLIDGAVQQLVAPERGKQDKRRAHVGRAVEALVAANVLRLQGDKVEVCE